MTDKNKHEDQFLICIAGPTGVGKTDVAIQIALRLNTEIISCDSRQIYKEMDIGTAKPSQEELNLVKHHMVDCITIEEGFSTGHYERDVIPLIEQLHQDNRSVILTGGTGLYFKAILEGLDTFPEVSAEIKSKLEDIQKNKGISGLQSLLKEVDPEYYNVIDRDNPHRLLRALGVTLASGLPYSSFLNQPKVQRPFTSILIFLNRDREELYDRINKRVIKMMDQGLLDEIKDLYPKRNLPALQTVGYQELFQYLDGEITLDEAISLIQQNSRRYAKRQITWYRNQGNWTAFHPEEIDDIIDYINSIMNK
ncbi:MAG: tRNA (adenosine(37)-N6)-dimethylallyltransferase MiaA [Saprospiraceae bacterium]|nr:tRNA (adenosine(37)-N6)-dimethylallyltransferase MiaA [Saprospiraceae bacterium]